MWTREGRQTRMGERRERERKEEKGRQKRKIERNGGEMND